MHGSQTLIRESRRNFRSILCTLYNIHCIIYSIYIYVGSADCGNKEVKLTKEKRGIVKAFMSMIQQLFMPDMHQIWVVNEGGFLAYLTRINFK